MEKQGALDYGEIKQPVTADGQRSVFMEQTREDLAFLKEEIKHIKTDLSELKEKSRVAPPIPDNQELLKFLDAIEQDCLEIKTLIAKDNPVYTTILSSMEKFKELEVKTGDFADHIKTFSALQNRFVSRVEVLTDGLGAPGVKKSWFAKLFRFGEKILSIVGAALMAIGVYKIAQFVWEMYQQTNR